MILIIHTPSGNIAGRHTDNPRMALAFVSPTAILPGDWPHNSTGAGP